MDTSSFTSWKDSAMQIRDSEREKKPYLPEHMYNICQRFVISSKRFEVSKSPNLLISQNLCQQH